MKKTLPIFALLFAVGLLIAQRPGGAGAGGGGAQGPSGPSGPAGQLGEVIPVSASRAVLQTDCGNTLQPFGASVIVTLNASLSAPCALAGVSVATYSLTFALSGGATYNASATSPALVLAACTGTVCPGQTITMTAANNWVSGAGPTGATGATGAAGPGFDPLDPTVFFRDAVTISGAGGPSSGYNQGMDGWNYSGGCAGNGGSGATGFDIESFLGTIWYQASGAATFCARFFPSTATGSYGSGTYDYWSGATPAYLGVQAYFKSVDNNGTNYVGLSSGAGTALGDFIGCRQIGSGHWFAVIIASGVDVATADTGATKVATTVRVKVDNVSGTANSIRCTVGAATATAAGTIPAQAAGWTYIYGNVATGASAAVFAPYQYTIYLTHLPRT